MLNTMYTYYIIAWNVFYEIPQRVMVNNDLIWSNCISILLPFFRHSCSTKHKKIIFPLTFVILLYSIYNRYVGQIYVLVVYMKKKGTNTFLILLKSFPIQSAYIDIRFVVSVHYTCSIQKLRSIIYYNRLCCFTFG